MDAAKRSISASADPGKELGFGLSPSLGTMGWKFVRQQELAETRERSAGVRMLVSYPDAALAGPLDDRSAAARTASAVSIHLSPGDSTTLQVVRIGGVELHAITEQQCIDHVLAALANGVGGTVVTPNLDIVRNCRRDLSFATLVAEADLAVSDGMPLIWASRVQGTPLPGRVAGSDLISSLSAAAADAGRSIFLLGGAPGTCDGAAEILKARSPHLNIVGCYCPPLGFEKNPDQLHAIETLLRAAKPDIVWVALGSPKQERLIAAMRNTLPGAWWLGIGISFSFLTGQVSRAPKWLQKIGMEWCHRLYQEPGRLAKRYLLHGLPFFAFLMISATYSRLTGNRNQSAPSRQFRGRRTKKNTATLNGNDSYPRLDRDSTRLPNAHPGDRQFTVSTRVASRTGSAERGLKRLKSVILLGGKVRQSSLSATIGRSVLDLPLDDDSTLLTHWVNQCNEMARRVGLEELIVRVMVDQKAHEPTSTPPELAHMVRVERDRSSFRGTGGLMADIAKDYDDEDMILVASASQILLDPLAAIAQALDHKTGEFTLISHRDGTAGGIMLLRCKTVRSISDVGYIDLKEQALPSIAKLHDVRVVHCRQPTGVPLFSLGDYIGGLQQFHRRRSSRRAKLNPLGEEFGRQFAIVEDGATVSEDAYLHDAVVLRGAIVEPQAAAIRSLVLPGAVVGRGRQVSDRLILAE